MKKIFALGLLVAASASAENSRELKFDFSDFKVGTAENTAGPTGATVFYFPSGGLAAVDVRGGAAAVRESSSVDPLNSYGLIDAIVLAGGSTYGLAAADGVMNKLLEINKGSTRFDMIPAVPAAVVYDFNGRSNSVFPDAALGAAAFDRARTNVVSVGRAGAGANVTVGKYFGRGWAEPSGQGAAMWNKGGLKIFALSVVNALGNILDKDGRVVSGSLNPKTGTRVSIAETLKNGSEAQSAESLRGNTTISILVTNAKLDRLELQRIAVMAHTGMARAIEPFHTPSDGDTLFVVSTRTEDKGSLSVSDLGTVSAALLQDAVRDSVRRP